MRSKTLHGAACALAVLGATFFLPCALHAQTNSTETSAPALAAFYPFPDAVPANTMTMEMVGTPVVIEGIITGYNASTGDRVPHRLWLVDKSESSPGVQIVYWPDVAAAVHGRRGPAAGMRVSAKGELGEYKGVLQVRIQNPRMIRLEGNGDADKPWSPPGQHSANGSGTMTVADALEAPIGTNVTLHAKVLSFRASTAERAPSSLKIGDDSGAIDVIFYADMVPSLPEELRTPGTEVVVSAMRQEFRGNAQLKLTRPNGIRTKAEADAATGGNGTTPVLAVDVDEIPAGHAAAISGSVLSIVAGTNGAHYAAVKDATGTTIVRIDPEHAALAEKLAPGAAVTARGTIAFDTLRAQPVLAATAIE